MEDPSTSQPSEQIIFRCVNCITDIRDIRFACKHDECEDVHLCGLCFCMQAELGKHKKTHPFEIWNEANFKLFASADEGHEWLCIDEQRLLQAVERYGHGNWQDVAAMVPGRSVKQVEEHYNDYYVDGNIGAVSWKVGGYSSERALVRDVGIPESSPKQIARNIQLLSNLEVAEMNYMPSRDEFYKEYDNEAEQEISQLVFQDGEDELDRKMKLALIDGCQRRLQERSRRKNVAAEFGLLHLFVKHQDAYPGCEGVRLHKGETRFRSEICANLKLFLQYMTFDELISFLQNLTSQIELKARIRDLCRARKHGVTRLDAMPHFEIARQHREKYMQGKDQPLGADLCRAESVEPMGCPPEGIAAELEEGILRTGSHYSDCSATPSDVSGWSGGCGTCAGGTSSPRKGRRRVPVFSKDRKSYRKRIKFRRLNGHAFAAGVLCTDLRIEPKVYMDYKLRIIFLVKHKRKKIGVLPGLTSVQTERIVKHLAGSGLLNRSKRLSKSDKECHRVTGCENRKRNFKKTTAKAERKKRHQRIDAASSRRGSEFFVTSSTEEGSRSRSAALSSTTYDDDDDNDNDDDNDDDNDKDDDNDDDDNDNDNDDNDDDDDDPEDNDDEEATCCETRSSLALAAKLKLNTDVEAVASQSSSCKSKTSLLATLGVTLGAKLEALRRSLTGCCSPTQLLQLKSQLSAQSFAIIQFLAVSSNASQLASVQQQQQSSSSASSTESSSDENSQRTTAFDQGSDWSEQSRQQEPVVVVVSHRQKNLNEPQQKPQQQKPQEPQDQQKPQEPQDQQKPQRHPPGDSGSSNHRSRFCVPFPPSNRSSAAASSRTASSTSSTSSTSAVIPAPNDHDYYSVRPQTVRIANLLGRPVVDQLRCSDNND